MVCLFFNRNNADPFRDPIRLLEERNLTGGSGDNNGGLVLSDWSSLLRLVR